MAISNTNILIKRSTSTAAPGTLRAGELAYSYLSNTMFIGTSDGTGVVNVGGLYYTSTIDQATSSNTAGTLVRRDENNGFHGALYGNANTTTQLLNARNFNITGSDITAEAVSFDGTHNVTLNAYLNAVPGLDAGSYGSTTEIPTVTVAANGRVMAIHTNTISTSLHFSGDNDTSNSVSLLDGVLHFDGTDGIVTQAGPGTNLTIGVDNTIVRSNVAGMVQTIDGVLNVSGDVNITGNITYAEVENLVVDESLLFLANNNITDAVDIGFVGQYGEGAGELFAGVFRHAGDKQFYVFDSYELEPTDFVITPGANGFNLGVINTNINAPKANISYANVTTANVTADLGVTGDIYNTGSVKSTQYKFNSGSETISTDGSSIILTPDTNTSALAGVKIGGNGYLLGPNDARNAQLNYNSTSGLLGIYNAQIYSGASSNSISSGALVVEGGVGISGNTYIGTNLSVSGTTVLTGTANTTHDLGVGGNAYLNANLKVDGVVTLQNALTVPNGGTGRTSFTTNGIVFGNDTGTLNVTAAAGASDQTWSNQILTVNNSGVPTWSTAMDGGQF